MPISLPKSGSRAEICHHAWPMASALRKVIKGLRGPFPTAKTVRQPPSYAPEIIALVCPEGVTPDLEPKTFWTVEAWAQKSDM